MTSHTERGQALAELMIVFPLFLVAGFGFLALFAQHARSHVDKANTISLALAEDPAASAEFVLNSSLLRTNSAGRENNRFPDAAPIRQGKECDGHRATYELNTNTSVQGMRVSLGTCASKAGYENQVRFVEPGARAIKRENETSPYEPWGLLSKKTRDSLPFVALGKAPPLASAFVHENFMNFNTHPIAVQQKFVANIGSTSQMSLCLAELCKMAAEHPFCFIGGGIALLATHSLQGGDPSGLCPVVAGAVSARYRVLHLAWRSRLTTLNP